MRTNREANADIASELAKIGIVAIESEDADGFLDGIAIRRGELHYQPECRPSNLLHEAGHLACIPPMFRQHADGDLDELAVTMCRYAAERFESGGNPDDPLIKAILQCSDSEATAWAWAFGVHVGLEPDRIIDSEDYQGEGDEVRLQVSNGMHFGVNGLRAAGFMRSIKQYPVLDKWTQDAGEE